jgi:hypothetical protein
MRATRRRSSPAAVGPALWRIDNIKADPRPLTEAQPGALLRQRNQESNRSGGAPEE